MYCAISGEIPQQPVVSRKTGHLFERRLIEKALQASENRCPVTGEELKPEDLLPVACDLAQRPRPLSATSLPAMLAMFQNEWDDLVVRIAASCGLSEIIRHRRDSPPSHDDVGGFVFDVGARFRRDRDSMYITHRSSPTRRASNCTLRGENSPTLYISTTPRVELLRD